MTDLTHLIEPGQVVLLETSMHVTIYGPNLRDQRRGDFHVHVQGCAHSKQYTHLGPDNTLDLDVDNRWDVIQVIYADFVPEEVRSVSGKTDIASNVYFAPCCRHLR